MNPSKDYEAGAQAVLAAVREWSIANAFRVIKPWSPPPNPAGRPAYIGTLGDVAPVLIRDNPNLTELANYVAKRVDGATWLMFQVACVMVYGDPEQGTPS